MTKSVRTEDDLRELFASEAEDTPELLPRAAIAFSARRDARSRWILPVAVAVGLAVLVTVVVAGSRRWERSDRAVSTSAPTTGPRGWVTEASGALSFSHPASWRYFPYTGGGTLPYTSSYLSTEPIQQRCHLTTVKVSQIETCGTPLPRLVTNGVRVTIGGPAHLTNPKPVTNSTVAGRPALITRGVLGADCQSAGGSAETTVWAPAALDGSRPEVQLTACFAGVNTETAQHDFDLVVGTVAFSSPTPDPACASGQGWAASLAANAVGGSATPEQALAYFLSTTGMPGFTDQPGIWRRSAQNATTVRFSNGGASVSAEALGARWSVIGGFRCT